MRWSAVAMVFLLTSPLIAQPPSAPEMLYKSVSDFFRLPPNLHLGETVAVALDSNGHIFVFNRMPGHPILEFDNAGSFVRSFGEDIFTSPHGLRVDPEGNIWATDRDAHVVLKMSADGRILLVLGRKDFPGIVGSKGEQLFDKPTDVAFGPSGDIFVADGEGNSRIVKFDRNGKFLKAWGRKGKGPSEFNVPHSVVADLQGRVYVADRENNRIQIFDSSGNFRAPVFFAKSAKTMALDPKSRRLFLSAAEMQASPASNAQTQRLPPKSE